MQDQEEVYLMAKFDTARAFSHGMLLFRWPALNHWCLSLQHWWMTFSQKNGLGGQLSSVLKDSICYIMKPFSNLKWEKFPGGWLRLTEAMAGWCKHWVGSLAGTREICCQLIIPRNWRLETLSHWHSDGGIYRGRWRRPFIALTMIAKILPFDKMYIMICVWSTRQSHQ